MMYTDPLRHILGITRLTIKHSEDFGETPFREVLMTPPPPTLLSGVEDPSFGPQFQEISSLLTCRPGLLSLFHIYLVTALLQTPEPVYPKARRFLMNHLDLSALLGFIPPPENPGVWCRVPMVLTSARRAYIRYMILGKMTSPVLGDIMPSWAIPLFDPASFEAVQTAARAAMTLSRPAEPTGLFCFPLTMPVPPAHPDPFTRFEGKSLGLPLALGFAALLNHHPLPRTLAATGEITDQGDIIPVSHMDLKKTGVADRGFTALIYPSAGTGFSSTGPLTCLPVSSLNQAYALFCLYSPESTQNLMLLSACLNDPQALTKNIGHLPCAWLQWITRHHLIQPAMETLTTDPHLFAACTDIFEKKAAAFDTAHARSIQALVPEEAVLQHMHTAPLSVFRWCTASLALANHCGDIEDAGLWEEKGRALADIIASVDLALLADFFNHALVARHNRYRFSPQLPPALTELLALLENQYHLKCNYGCPTDPVLGRLYGTLMQHFAFCGPAYLDRTRNFFHKAVQALGKDRVIEYRQEWLRQYNYLTYALLDAGDLTGARQSLITCFERRDMNDLVAHLCDPAIRLSPWHTALGARYFAQDRSHPDRKIIFKHLLRQFQTDPGHAHPRQLTAFNLGRMALNLQNITTGKALLHQSIDLCFSPDAGPTIRVMALLPISFLPDTALPAPPVLKTWEQTIHSAAAHLDAIHFSSILETPLDKARHRIKHNPAVWFPFNYR